MKVCRACSKELPVSNFYKRGNYYRPECKPCHSALQVERVSTTRRQTKRKLVEFHGGKCVDCGYKGPPFMYDFDHRNPTEKSFGISSNGGTLSFKKQLEESLKCDLVCANCHRFRTHRQRCNGCEYC